MLSTPEGKPPGTLHTQAPLSKFTFSTAMIEGAKRENELELEAIRARISRIIEKFCVGDMTIIDKVLSLTHDPDDLRGLAKGLGRVAELIERHDKLEVRSNVLVAAEADIGWFGSAFGDFEEEINLLDSFPFTEDT